MRKPQQHVFVNGVPYSVRECSGVLKADLNGYFGWKSVWAETHTQLTRRIKQVIDGRGQ